MTCGNTTAGKKNFVVVYICLAMAHLSKHLYLSYWGMFPQCEDHSHLAAADAINYWVYVYVDAA